MRKTILSLIIGMIVPMPVMAATQWYFGASLRQLTFWTEQNAGKHRLADLENGGAILKNDALLDWRTRPNSRIKMFMKSDKLEGFIEMGYNAVSEKVTTREYWGKYKINDMGYIAIGQQRQLFNQETSRQAWGGNSGMNGIGAAFKPPTPKIIVGYGNFAVAFGKVFTARVDYLKSAMSSRTGGISRLEYDVDLDANLPQLQACYEYFTENGHVKFSGAYQYLKLDSMRQQTLSGVHYTKGTEIHSWVVGLDGSINFGPLHLAAAASAGQNWSDAGWSDETGCINPIWTGNYFSDSFGIQPKYRGATGATDNFGWGDTTSAMLSFTAAYQLTEALRFEAGAGYRYNRNRYFAAKSRLWNIYFQAAYSVTQGFTVIPEIGHLDFGKHIDDGKNAGSLWYAGIQWRMDF